MSTPSVRTVPALALLLAVVCGLRDTAAFNVLPSGAAVFQVPAAERASGDYFGYSVALNIIAGSSWLMVAAPRAQSRFETQYSRPGALFRCPATGGGDCQAVRLLQGSSQSGTADPLEINNGTLGGSMDAELGKEGMVICNPAYKELAAGSSLNMPGMCYWLYNFQNNGVSVLKWKPPLLGDSILVDHGTPSFGFSAHQMKGTEEEVDCLIGGPGFFAGRGAVVRYEQNMRRSIIRKSLGIPNPEVQEYDYFGYSVISGKFQPSGKSLCVGSAPRAGHLKGKVFIYNCTSEEKVNDVTVLKLLNGAQIGAYYGAVLAVADINGDNVDDLLVGAPLHKTKTGDEGKVYVYLTSGKNESTFLDIEEEIQPKVKFHNARFGTSIASLGDIDKDGYTDIAIGAPYEDSERGTVYIYYGSSEAPYLKYEQRIRALDINNHLGGFGFSFSRGGDIDNNMYNDFAVGAYLSGHAVMLRTSPVLRINSSATIRTDKIPMFTELLPITFCVRPNELHADTGIEVTVNIDPVFSRGSIDGKKIIKYKLNMTKTNLKDECWTTRLSLKNNSKIYKPLEIEFSYKILFPIQGNGPFCKICPVLDFKNPRTSHFLHYHTGCEGHVCKTNFTLAANFRGVRSPFTIGTKNMSNIEMVVEVANLLEPSYETNITVIFPSAVGLRQSDKSCYHLKFNSTDFTKLICEVPYMIQKNSKPFSFSLSFDMDSIPWNISRLQVNISVEGSGEEQYVADNNVTLQLELLHIADISIKGRPDKERLSFAHKRNDSDDYVYEDKVFEHIYTVSNNGPSPVYGLSIKFMIPHSLNVGGTNITYLKVEPVTHYILTLDAPKNEEEPHEYEDTSVSEKVIDDNSLMLDCSLPEVVCHVIEYNNKQPLLAKSGITLTFRMTGFFREQGPLLKYSKVHVISTGNIQNEFILNQDLPGKPSFDARTETILFGKVLSQEGIQSWIIVVGIICGILLLLIMCAVLWKLGFFKRNKPPTPEEAEADKPDTREKEDTDPLCENDA